jgi:hypothetical protein
VLHPSTTSAYPVRLIFQHNKIKTAFFIFHHLHLGDHGTHKLATIRQYHDNQSWARHPRLSWKVPRNMCCNFPRWGCECKSAIALNVGRFARQSSTSQVHATADICHRVLQDRASNSQCDSKSLSPWCSSYLHQRISVPSITTRKHTGDT